MWDDAEFICAFCGQKNYIQVDPSGGFEQELEEECQICCQPNLIHITIDPESLDSEVTAEMEAE